MPHVRRVAYRGIGKRDTLQTSFGPLLSRSSPWPRAHIGRPSQTIAPRLSHIREAIRKEGIVSKVGQISFDRLFDGCCTRSRKKMAQTKLMWSNLGQIRTNMTLDHIPKQAGVYKLTFRLWGNTYTYIGEAGARGLRARIADYANHPPAEGNKVEHLLHDLLREAGEADLSVCCTGVTVDEQKARRIFEKEAVAATHQDRLMCLNSGGYSVDVPMRRFVLKSAEKMLIGDLEHVRAKLAKEQCFTIR